jgi:Ion channel
VSTSQWGTAVAGTLGLALAIATVIAFTRRRYRAGRYLAAATYVMFWPIHGWFWQFELTGRTATSTASPSYIFNGAVIQIFGGIVILIISCFYRFRPVLTALFLAYLFSLILQLFSYVYWTYGTTRNFSANLTHFDSFYFALGTLTTVGSGTITANSETVRQIQAVQMGLDLLLIGFAVTVILARYTSLLSRPRPEFPWLRPGEPTPRQQPPPGTDRIARQTNTRRRRAYLKASPVPALRNKRPRT